MMENHRHTISLKKFLTLSSLAIVTFIIQSASASSPKKGLNRKGNQRAASPIANQSTNIASTTTNDHHHHHLNNVDSKSGHDSNKCHIHRASTDGVPATMHSQSEPDKDVPKSEATFDSGNAAEHLHEVPVDHNSDGERMDGLMPYQGTDNNPPQSHVDPVPVHESGNVLNFSRVEPLSKPSHNPENSTINSNGLSNETLSTGSESDVPNLNDSNSSMPTESTANAGNGDSNAPDPVVPPATTIASVPGNAMNNGVNSGSPPVQLVADDKVPDNNHSASIPNLVTSPSNPPSAENVGNSTSQSQPGSSNNTSNDSVNASTKTLPCCSSTQAANGEGLFADQFLKIRGPQKEVLEAVRDFFNKYQNKLSIQEMVCTPISTEAPNGPVISQQQPKLSGEGTPVVATESTTISQIPANSSPPTNTTKLPRQQCQTRLNVQRSTPQPSKCPTAETGYRIVRSKHTHQGSVNSRRNPDGKDSTLAYLIDSNQVSRRQAGRPSHDPIESRVYYVATPRQSNNLYYNGNDLYEYYED